MSKPRVGRGYKSPVLATVYQHNGKKNRKVGEYRTNEGMDKKLGLYAEVMPEAQVYVERRDEWYKVEFSQVHIEGRLVEWGWKLVESKGVEK